MSSSNQGWQDLLLPEDLVHPMLFLRPDTILHVHDLWTAGRHQDDASHEFSLRDVSTIRPFVMVGSRLCTHFLKDWRITPADIVAFRALPSLEELSDEFWQYLAGFERFRISMSAIQDGELFGQVPMYVDANLASQSGGQPISFPLIRVAGESAQVALVSEAIGTILDFSIDHSIRITAHVRAGRPRVFYGAEREMHPMWSRFANEVEFVLNARTIFDTDLNHLWMWVDPKRVPDQMSEAQRNGAALQRKGLTVTLLVAADNV